MSFSSNVKDELLRLPLGKSCCELMEISVLTQTVGSLQLKGGGRFNVTWRMESASLAKRLLQLLRDRLGVNPALSFIRQTRLGGRSISVLTLNDEDSQKLLMALHMMEQEEDGSYTLRRRAPRYVITRQCCRRAFLRAAFLGAGTMSAPEKSYNLEWTAEDATFRQMLFRVLEKSQLPALEHVRRDKNVVYMKKGQTIVDTLALMGAPSAMLQMENIRIQKQMRRNANRISNCDEHNSEKMVEAAQQQLEAIKIIDEVMGIDNLPPALR